MLRIPYIFVCKDIEWVGVNVNITNLLDMVYVKDFPTKLDQNLVLIVGITGDETDHGQEFFVTFRGKNFKAGTPPLKYTFSDYDEIHILALKLEGLPLDEPQTIYFNVEYKDKKITEYPVKFLREEG